jgi:hypothetical protein
MDSGSQQNAVSQRFHSGFCNTFVAQCSHSLGIVKGAHKRFTRCVT